MTSALSDELVQQLVAAGQVDVLVGVPTRDDAATIGTVVSAVHRAFARAFPRERTLLLIVDSGSTDGTTDVVRALSPSSEDSIVAAQALRTSHRITVPYHGQPGRASALRTILTSADLLQARAVAVLDPDVTSIDPGWVEQLVRPALRDGADYVAPVFEHSPIERPLVTQFLQPLLRATYRWRIREPLASEFGCSGRLAAHVLADGVWDPAAIGEGIDLWLLLESLATGLRCAEVFLGARRTGEPRERPGLPAAFGQIHATAMACLERHERYWLARDTTSGLDAVGTPPPAHDGAEPLDADALARTFRAAVHEIEPVLASALPEDLALAVRAAASGDGVPSVDDALWARLVVELVLADREGRLPRAHAASTLVPLYLGRASSFLSSQARRPADQVEAALESLAVQFESLQPVLASRWPTESRR